VAAKIPSRGRRGAGASGSRSLSTSGIGDIAWSSLLNETEEVDVFLECTRDFVGLKEWPELARAMNSQDGAVWGSVGDAKLSYSIMCCGIEANWEGADVGGMPVSGEEARVVPDQNEGTGEDGDAMLGAGSH
jgi:hypothetical protein